MTDPTPMPETPAPDREAIAPAPNPLGLDGIEFIAYATAKPQALDQRGVECVDSRDLHSEGRGALSRTFLGSVGFELVHDPR